MAVQKSRVTPSRRNMRRRANSKFTPQTVSTDQETGTMHLRHHVTPDGYYRGKKVIDTSAVETRD